MKVLFSQNQLRRTNMISFLLLQRCATEEECCRFVKQLFVSPFVLSWRSAGQNSPETMRPPRDDGLARRFLIVELNTPSEEDPDATTTTTTTTRQPNPPPPIPSPFSAALQGESGALFPPQKRRNLTAVHKQCSDDEQVG